MNRTRLNVPRAKARRVRKNTKTTADRRRSAENNDVETIVYQRETSGETYDKRGSRMKYRGSMEEARNYAKLPNITEEHAKQWPSRPSLHRIPYHLPGVPNIQVFSCVVGSTGP